jgi:AAA family ATP:ADP antiporter
MRSRLRNIFKFLLEVEPHERLKVLLLTISFFLIIGGYTVAKELKDSLFVSIVGKEYIPWAKILSMVILIPPILLYSKLVDLMRRYQLLYVYTLVYSIGLFAIAYFLAHPVIGLNNAVPSKYRFFGWIIYFFIEGYSPFVVSLFWAFANSITSPEAAKNNYPLMIAGSKVGGMCMTGFCLWLLQRSSVTGEHLFSDVTNHQILLGVSGALLLFVPWVIRFLMAKVPGRYLHGYEAAYKVEKQRATHTTPTTWTQSFLSMMSGLTMLMRYPYVMGIFGMIFFWEVVNVVFGYERLSVGQAGALSISDYSRFLFEGVFFVHAAGFVIVLFGTKALINLLGERRSLMLIPTLTGILLIYYLTSKSVTAVLVVYVLIRSLNYAFAYPLRESLYIPTTKDMKFKSKSWIDAFGAKVAKSCGSYYNVFLEHLAPGLVGLTNVAFFSSLIGLWVITAHLLGRRFEKAVASNEVIGAQEECENLD